jgi:hypothetical protein
MDSAPEVKITYTSHRYWRIVFPLFVLALIAEYVYLFFFAWPATENLARNAQRAGPNVVASINNSMKQIANAATAAANAVKKNAAAAAATAVTATTNATKKLASQ